MLGGVSEKDVITVLIFMNDMLINESTMVIEHLREIVDEKLNEVFDERFKVVVDREIEEYLRIRGFIE
jgi:hypothetical protein